MKVALPHLYAERLPSGVLRYRVQRMVRGRRARRTVHGEPGTAAFQAAYERALVELSDAPQPGAPETSAGYTRMSVGWLVGEFMTTMARREEAGLVHPSTLRRYRLQLGRLISHVHVSDRHPKGIEVGRLHAELPKRVVIEIRDHHLRTPAAADSFVKSVRSLYAWAAKEGVADIANPAEKVGAVDVRSEGYAIWSLAHVQAYLRHHRPGTRPRLAMVLALCTAARRGDLVTLGPRSVHLEEGTPWIRWRQEKPPHIDVDIPMLNMLAEELARHAPDGETWLGVGPSGARRSKKAFGALFARWRADAGLPEGLSLHGVRKGVASILPELGVSTYGVDVLLGHELGSAASQVYTKGARRREIAREVNAEWARVRWE